MTTLTPAEDVWLDDGGFNAQPDDPLVDLDQIDISAEWATFRLDQSMWVSDYVFQEKFLASLRLRVNDPSEVDSIEWCADCGKPGADLESTNEDNFACRSCFDDDYDRCHDCDEWFRYTTSTLNDSRVCHDCRDNNWSFCDDCDGYYPDNDGCGEDHDSECGCEAPAQTFTIRNDGDDPLGNDDRVTIALPAGHISAEGLDRIRQRVLNFAYGLGYLDEEAAEKSKLIDLSYSLHELGDTWQTRQGNYTKRLSSLAYKTFSLKIRPALLSEVGCIARDNSTAVDFEIDVTRDLNQSAGDFYHEESCWWQSYAASRCALKSNGGFGLRTFEGREVTGRAWVMPLKEVDGNLTPTFETQNPDAFVVFNGYGNLSGYVPARIISHMAGWTYRKIGFTCRAEDTNGMYVNNDLGYLVAGEEIAQRYTDGSLHLKVDLHSALHITETRILTHAA